MSEKGKATNDRFIEEMKQLQIKADALNDELPHDLAKKIELYSMVLMKVGRLHASAVFDYGKAYADRKNAWGLLITSTEGTAKDKEGNAEFGTHQARILEATAEQEVTRWKNAFIATQELINAMKKRLDLLRDEHNKGPGVGN